MNEEDKKLLLKDLCARLPYGVKVEIVRKLADNIGNGGPVTLHSHHLTYLKDKRFINENEEESWWVSVKPYLRPMSSMTDEERFEYGFITERWMYDATYSISDSIDWLNSHHFDYRNLFEKGLAIEAPEGMYKQN